MSKRPQDHWGHKARKEGYAARSVYKLEEIDRRARILKHGGRVLDLGAYPGSWTSYAAQVVGPRGKVLGLDLQEFKGTLPPHAEIRTGDVLSLELEKELGPASFDTVISDMAPDTTGHRFTDQARSFRLFMRALEIAVAVLPAGGNFVAKIFVGEDFHAAQQAVRAAFEETKVIKPPASRTESYETFVVGMRRRGKPTAPPSSLAEPAVVSGPPRIKKS
ncbi:MAG: RlmE family RNA methyltransferase [Deltaproteobacteria bacterium]|nr:RlmE family RNA methyltransferase [Deltaproteobacteria bacterium]